MATSYYSTRSISEVLSRATADERLAMTKVFDADARVAQSPEELTDTICSAGGHAIANWLRSQGVPYTELLHDVAKTLKVEGVQARTEVTRTGSTVGEMDERALNSAIDAKVVSTWRWSLDEYIHRHEQEILKKFMADSYERMSPAQRAEVDRKLAELAKQLPGSGAKGLTGSAALLAVANAGGFATYMLMSTVISTLSVGTAAFAVYTTASSILHVLIGPVGWAALGLTAIYRLGGPNQQKCVQSVLAIAMLRSRLDQQCFVPAHG
jgi:uncharacterized protein YaaW (UPF0174 family)